MQLFRFLGVPFNLLVTALNSFSLATSVHCSWKKAIFHTALFSWIIVCRTNVHLQFSTCRERGEESRFTTNVVWNVDGSISSFLDLPTLPSETSFDSSSLILLTAWSLPCTRAFHCIGQLSIRLWSPSFILVYWPFHCRGAGETFPVDLAGIFSLLWWLNLG